uniref:Chemokine interleukin-8-like domain-containing protein n=1 Tax=Anabas testudineus TaxID=64144 RepID=A0A7N6BK61_ANATE
MSFSVRSGVCLLFLTTLLTLPEHGYPYCDRPSFKKAGHVAPPCCPTVSAARIKERITSCFEQPKTTFPQCNKHAFIFVTASETQHCVDPGASWVKTRVQKLQSRGICCHIL